MELLELVRNRMREPAVAVRARPRWRCAGCSEPLRAILASSVYYRAAGLSPADVPELGQ
jgi:hypothetical protein